MSGASEDRDIREGYLGVTCTLIVVEGSVEVGRDDEVGTLDGDGVVRLVREVRGSGSHVFVKVVGR